jgi:hypothetical protein
MNVTFIKLELDSGCKGVISLVIDILFAKTFPTGNNNLIVNDHRQYCLSLRYPANCFIQSHHFWGLGLADLFSYHDSWTPVVSIFY